MLHHICTTRERKTRSCAVTSGQHERTVDLRFWANRQVGVPPYHDLPEVIMNGAKRLVAGGIAVLQPLRNPHWSGASAGETVGLAAATASALAGGAGRRLP